MLTNVKASYYAIYTTKNIYNGSIDEIYDTLEEAKLHIMEHADWRCSKGTCTIKHYVLDKTTAFGPECEEYWNFIGGVCTLSGNEVF